MQMNDATEPLKIIIGAAVATAAQRKIYFLIFNGVNAYRKTEKRKTKKTKKAASKKAMQMQLSAEQNVFEMKSLRSGGRGAEQGGFWERKSLSALCLDFDFVHIGNLYTVLIFFFLGIFVLL